MTEKSCVYVVTYQDGDKEPVVSVFNNKTAAFAYRDEEGKRHDRIWLDKAPIFSRTMVNGVWFGDAPIIEPERKKGKWIGKPLAGYCTVRCSACNNVFLRNDGRWNFCPNCGVDMREEQE